MATEHRNKEARDIWAERLAEWRSSGLSQAEYCRRHNFKQHGFTYWKKRLAETEHGFVALPVAPEQPPVPLFELRIEDNFRIHLKLNFDVTFHPGANE